MKQLGDYQKSQSHGQKYSLPAADKEAAAAEFSAAMTKKRAGRPVSATHKTPHSRRLSDDDVEFFRSTGKGWQTRINEALREYVKEHHSA
ncbi:MAG: BrnA antitoxin family protein [Thermodesulfovibrionales bacterium]